MLNTLTSTEKANVKRYIEAYPVGIEDGNWFAVEGDKGSRYPAQALRRFGKQWCAEHG